MSQLSLICYTLMMSFLYLFSFNIYNVCSCGITSIAKASAMIMQCMKQKTALALDKSQKLTIENAPFQVQ